MKSNSLRIDTSLASGRSLTASIHAPKPYVDKPHGAYLPPSPAETVVAVVETRMPPDSNAELLPDSVLRRIFSHLAPAAQIFGGTWVPRSSSDALAVLGHEHLRNPAAVCRQWQRAASSPELWRIIELDLQEAGGDERRVRIQRLLEEVLRRSVGEQLEIHLRVAQLQAEVHADTLRMLVASSHRWKTANIVISGATPDARLRLQWLAPLNGNLPVLERIAMEPLPLVRLTKVPQLKSTYLRLNGRRSRLLRSLESIALYDQSLHLALNLHPSPASGFMPELQSPARELHLTVWDWTREEGALKRILDRALARLQLPNVQALTLASAHPIGNPLAEGDLLLAPITFREFLTRSNASGLCRLSLLNIAIDPQALPACLAVLDALEELALSDIPGTTVITTALIKRLTPHVGYSGSCANAILPRLHTLVLETAQRFEPTALCDFVNARERLLGLAPDGPGTRSCRKFRCVVNAHLPHPSLKLVPAPNGAAGSFFDVEMGVVLKSFGTLRAEAHRRGMLAAGTVDARLVDGWRKRMLRSSWATIW
ncbi:hypothetical protein HMN09_00925100 [Mycena chlorophos]|uniref:F-box domain-containing protein n=1 Tax=Mycena chlorophos TaxID=658473 RepID=A0A8H6W5V5_MYCCL|nr:hypothetical protein HMN09_00925100 [Mycena chlorophos]